MNDENFCILSSRLDPIRDANKIKDIISVSKKLIEQYGGIVPDRTLMSQSFGKYSRSMYSAQWDVGNVDEDLMSSLEDLSAFINQPWIVEGRKDMFGEKNPLKIYTSLKGVNRPTMRGYLIKPNVGYQSNMEYQELWAVARYGSKNEAEAEAKRHRFYKADDYLIDYKDRDASAIKMSHWIVSLGILLGGNPTDISYSDILSSCFSELVRSRIEETHFSDIIGLDEQIQDFIFHTFSPCINSEVCKEFNYAPRSQILVGVPGTGKTLIAKAAAYDIDALYFPVDMEYLLISGFYDDLNELSSKTGRDVVVFCEDLDVLLSSDMPENVSSKLLNVLDGINQSENIIFCGSANNPVKIDPRFLRGDRIDYINHIPLPSKKTVRKKMLEMFTEGVSLDTDVSLDKVASNTDDFTGSLLKKLVEDSKVIAMKGLCGSDVGKFRNLQVTESSDKYSISAADLQQACDGIKLLVKRLDLKNWDKKIKEWSKGFTEIDYYV